MKAYILSIGDEILIGQILNTNANWMATELTLAGIYVERIVTLPDEKSAILEEVEQACKAADLVLITGGLGPTKDDITKKTLAEYFGMEMEYHAPSFDNIASLFQKFGRSMPDDRYKIQAHMPVGADIMINKMGTASGMWFEHQNGCILCSMPGVPREMKYLVEHEIMPRLRKSKELPAIVHDTILSFGRGETDLSTMLEEFEEALPSYIKLAYLPNTSTGYVRLRLTAKGDDKQQLHAEVELQMDKMRAILGSWIVGKEHEWLEVVVGDRLNKLGLSLGTAESCTGGNIAHKITSIPGSSAYYMGSLVTYSNEAKVNLLKVNAETLNTYGAVSEQTVKEMVLGALEALNVDYAIATSGIAGPTGGTDEKPVGTIWVAVGNKDYIYTKKLQLGNNRERNIEMTSNVALALLNKQLMDLELKEGQ
jgi:nicotinamide-nucleotide amidase